MNHIDIVYFINLDHRKDRLEEITGVLRELEIPSEKIHRISAVYEPNFGTLGCAKSHMNALEHFIDSRLQTCLVFEDDFMYEDKERFIQSMEYVFKNEVKFDLIMLAYNHNGVEWKPTEHSILRKASRVMSISGILVSKEFAPKLLENYKEGQEKLINFVEKHNRVHRDYIIDVYWQRLQRTSNWFCFSPRLGYQRDSFSDIEKKHVKYKV
jgi:GR25 family glycosyltransferase involved in LPS biosynthesis